MKQPPSRSLFVVGDDAQSIYAFRGSRIEIILNFANQYPQVNEIILNQNYRSTQPILDLAEKVLTHNTHQKKKELFTTNPEKIDVHYYLAHNERDEAEYIIRQLHQLYVLKERESKRTQENKSTKMQVDEFDPFQELTLHTDEDEARSSIYNSSNSLGPSQVVQPVSSNRDSISSMFDLYLDQSDFTPISPYNKTFTSSSWSVPEYDWISIKDLNNVAVLYRTHGQSRALEEIFLKYHLPYRLISGTRFLDRKEIKDVLSILRYMSNGADKISLSRFLPLVLEGVGLKTLDKIMAFLDDFQYPLAPKHQKQIVDLISKMQFCWQSASNLIDLTKELLVATGYFRYLKAEYPGKEEFDQRIENIGELYSLMYAFDERKELSLPEKLTQLLIHISLMSQLDNSESDSTPKINLMSLHQSKGLEFETVFLVGVEDGILPHQNSFIEQGGMEEEVRLAYVGVTRAKKYLYLISADSRIQFGQVKANPMSRIFRPFLDSHVKRSK